MKPEENLEPLILTEAKEQYLLQEKWLEADSVAKAFTKSQEDLESFYKE